MPLLAGLSLEPASRLVSNGSTAWFVLEAIAEDGNRGVLVAANLVEL